MHFDPRIELVEINEKDQNKNLYGINHCAYGKCYTYIGYLEDVKRQFEIDPDELIYETVSQWKQDNINQYKKD